MSRVLLTGASGFIGRHAVDPLLAGGHEVHAVGRRRGIEPPGVKFHHVDLLEPGGAEALLADVRPDHLVHLAWYTEPGRYWTSLENYRWVEASLGLLRSFRELGGTRAVVAGTCAEYDWSHRWLSEATTPLRPSTPYGLCKKALWDLSTSYAEASGLSLSWARVFFLYGPHEHPARLVASTARALLVGEPALCSPADQIRPVLHVQDAADALVALLDSPVTGAVNIASGEGVRLGDLVERVAHVVGRPELLRLGALPPRPGEPKELAADCARLRNDVGWSPSFDLDSGLRHTVEWWRHQLSSSAQP